MESRAEVTALLPPSPSPTLRADTARNGGAGNDRAAAVCARMTAHHEVAKRAAAAGVAAALHVETLTRGLVLRLTVDLLNSPLMIGGTRVSWGDATREQLEDRRRTLIAKLSGDAQTVARLDVAITALRQSGATNLRALSEAGTSTIGTSKLGSRESAA